MNDRDLRIIANELRKVNAKNKRQIANKRAKFARTKASLENLPQPTTFPTTYKYG